MSLVLNSIEQLNLSRYELAIGCSGGVDSTVLIHACLTLGFKPTLLHVNYQLRGSDSDGDAKFLQDLAKKNGLKIETRICPKELTKGEGINLQLAARNYRYDFFRAWLKEDPNRKLLLAHHQDDQIETFFLQLARGSGLFGLGGMHTENEGIIRPFLELTKKQLCEFANEKNISWREDTTNVESDYARNKLRNIILPELLQSFPDLVTSVTFLQTKFREKQAELNLELRHKIDLFRQQGEITFSTWSTLTLEHKLLVFKGLNLPMYLIGRVSELEQSRLSACLDDNILIRTKQGFSWLNEFPCKNTWEFKSESIGILPKNFSNDCVYIDMDKLSHPLESSYAKTNDTIKKPGNRFLSNVFRLMKDKGLPQQWRNSYPILKCGDQVVWIPFIAVDVNYLASESSKNIQKVFIKD